MKRKILPPTYFVVVLLILIILHFVFPISKFIFSPYNLIGAISIIFGIFLNLWTDNLFKKHNTAVKPHLKPSFFISSGPFEISRHPMYLGMTTILFGVAIILGSVITFIFPVLFIIFMELIFIPIEEKSLEKVLGKKYLNYKKKVRKWN